MIGPMLPGHFRWPEERAEMLAYVRESHRQAVAVRPDGTEHFNMWIPAPAKKCAACGCTCADEDRS